MSDSSHIDPDELIDFQRIYDEFAERFNTDIIFWNGPIERGHEFDFVEMCAERKLRENVLLILVTSGGDAHAAYRIARCLQRKWKRFTAFIPGWCKSAGTLLILGAHELVMTEHAELGPIDVQRDKPDELWAQSSGLTEDAALRTLEKTATLMFNSLLVDIKSISSGRITFKTAAEAASKIVVGVLEPIYSQIDPFKIGENARSMSIAYDYGFRLYRLSKNLKGKDKIEQLTTYYSAHSFVIDIEEARDLFIRVADHNAEHFTLLDTLKKQYDQGAYFPLSEETPLYQFINSTPIINETQGDEGTSEKARDNGSRNPESEADERDIPDPVLGGDISGTEGPSSSATDGSSSTD